MEALIKVSDFKELYAWLQANHRSESFVWVNAKRGKPNGRDFSYIDAVYCALCFGWIDTTCKNIEGITYQKITPRSKKSHWTYLNIARCKYLIEQGIMTEAGLNAMPPNRDEFSISQDILQRLRSDERVWVNFNRFPQLYQRIRIDNIEWTREKKGLETFAKRLDKLIETCRENKLYGEWNDYGRLS